jgi:uncharacterized protein (DUF1778 family)
MTNKTKNITVRNTLNLRIKPEERDLINMAAKVLGTSKK